MFSINSTCKYLKLLGEERQTLRRWFAKPHITLPVFISLLWILSFSLKSVADPKFCLLQHFQDIRQHIFPLNTISVTYKRNMNLEEILSPSLFSRTTKQKKIEYLQVHLMKKFVDKKITILTKFYEKEKNTGKRNYLR